MLLPHYLVVGVGVQLLNGTQSAKKARRKWPSLNSSFLRLQTSVLAPRIPASQNKQKKIKDEIDLILGIMLSQRRRPLHLLVTWLHISSHFMTEQ